MRVFASLNDSWLFRACVVKNVESYFVLRKYIQLKMLGGEINKLVEPVCPARQKEWMVDKE